MTEAKFVENTIEEKASSCAHDPGQMAACFKEELEKIDIRLFAGMSPVFRLAAARQVADYAKSNPNDETPKKLMKAMGQNWPMDPLYIEIQREREGIFVRRLIEDNAVAAAAMRWKKLDKGQKMAILQHIHRLHGKSYSFSAGSVSWALWEPLGKEIVFGIYSPAEGVRLNTHSQARLVTSFKKALEIVVHEGTHTKQNELALAVKRRQYASINSMEHDQAQAFAWTANQFYTPREDGKTGYLSTQTERDAFRQGRRIAAQVCKMLEKRAKTGIIRA